MVNQDYVDFLVDYGSTLGPTEVAPAAGALTSNGRYLQAKKLDLFMKIENGQGAVITGTTFGGQSVALNVPMTLLDQAAAYKQAIDILTGNMVRTTYARFF